MSETKKSCCGVVILNYNSHDLTKRLAERVAQMTAVDAVCVVDNHSNDDFDGDFSHPKIHYIKNTKNAGYSAGNNVGLHYLIDEKGCDYVFIANPDVIFQNETIEEMLTAMRNNPKLALVSTKRYGHDRALIHQFFDFPPFWTSVKNCFFLLRRRFEKKRHIIQNHIIDEAKLIHYVDAVPGAFFGIRRKFLRENNYIYEGIFLYGEEIILGRQAKNLGYQAGVINTSEYIHDHVQTRFSNRKMFWYDRKSLKQYYRLFGDLNVLQQMILNIAIIIGTIEYNFAYYTYHLLNKS